MKWIAKNIVLTGLCLFGFISSLQAGIEPVLRNTMTGTSIRVDSFRIIEDLQYSTSNLSAYQLYKAENFVTVEINQDQLASCYLDTFSFWANVEITGWDESGTPTVDTGYFEVFYNQNVGTQYKGIHTKRLTGFYKIKLKVLSVSNTALTDYISISGEIALERYKTLDTASYASVSSSSYNSSTGNITVNWSSVTGAEEYDLEYTFVDDYTNANIAATLTTADIDVDFSHNASRVTVKGTSYSFSNVFERGYVVFRVRPASYTGANFTYRITGKWTNQTYSKPLSAYSSSERLAVSPLEPTFNWQYVNTFSEWGKRKELISFMDGSFRSRQSLTRVSSDTTVIVGESVYDYQGRPALQVLPVPLDETVIKYYPDFNLDSAGGTEYNRIHFDTGFCDLISLPMDTLSGASQYYSSGNTFLSNSTHWLSDHNPYIPRANGRPFVRTIFTDDNSGRVAIQSGVGREHEIGSGHETRYYYGTPYQEELDRLFGNYVGFAEHYQKQMVIDPNGQVSVSYTDLSGKVIATALSGSSPGQVQILSNNLGKSELNVALIPHNLESMPDPYTTVVQKKINVAVSGEYRLNYILDLTSFSDNCMTGCYECVYDLSISILDECGQELLDGDLNTSGIQPFSRELKKVDSTHYSVSCLAGDTTYKSVNDDLLSDSMRVTLGIGSYFITKTLTVSEKAANFYADLYVQDTACVKDEQYFIDYYKSIIDDFGCNISCEACTELLADSAEYITNRRQELVDLGYADNGAGSYNGNYLLQMAEEEYAQKKAVCNSVCELDDSPCDYMAHVMEVDVSPGGQYEELDGDITKHPEYCKYQFCINNPDADSFLVILDAIDGQQAIDLGLMNPIQSSGVNFPMGNTDTFFMKNSSYAAILQAELDAVISVPDIYSTYHDLNIWEASVWISHYVLGEDTIPYSTFAAAQATNNAYDYYDGRCTMKDPMLWEIFRGLYKVARSKAIAQIMASTTCSTMSIPAEKEIRFKSTDDVEGDIGGNESQMSARFYADCGAACDSMSGAWMSLLGECVENSPYKEAIRVALVAKCAAGCGPDNPMGSSDGFKEVLEAYSVYEAGICDPRIITTPPLSTTYDEFGLDSSDNHCACEDNEDPCLYFKSDLQYRNVIRTLYYASQDIECDTLCIECSDIQKALVPFFEELGDTLVVLDSTAQWPLIMTAFLNNKLKVNHDFDTYLEFMAKCAGVQNENIDDDSVVQRFQGLPEPIEYVNRQKYIDSITYEIETSSVDIMPGEDYFRPNPGIAYAYNTQTSPSATGLYWYESREISVLQPNLLTCTGEILLDPCVCGKLMDKIKNTPALADPSYGGWDSIWTCTGVDLDEVLQACASAWMNKEGKDIRDMDSLTWDHQDSVNLWELARADDLYLPVQCRQDLGCDDCESKNPPPAPPVYHHPTGDGGEEWYIHSTPHTPIVYTPYLPCDSILAHLDSFITANFLMLSKPMSEAHLELAANYIDSLFSGDPYFREKTSLDPNDDLEYRMNRLLADIQRCTASPFEVDPCYNAHNSAAKVREYLACDSVCIADNDLPPLVREWLRQETKLVKTASALNLLAPARTNLLVANEHNMYTKLVDAYYDSDLYTGSSETNLVHSYTRGMSYRGPGPKKFIISDGADTVQLTLSFFAPDEKLSMLNRIRGIISIKPYKTLPCDNTMNFVLEVMVEDKDKNVYILPMFGTTDTYELMDICGTKPKLCGRGRNVMPLLGEMSDCVIDVDLMAEAFGKRYHDMYIDSVRAGFINKYKTHCIRQAIPTESLTMRFDQQEYQYTLYYYDQAGNLIQTVPPAGVEFGTALQVQLSMNKRALNLGSGYYPSHDLPTYYQYNTLNELKWQATPDGGVSDFWYDQLGRLVVSRNAKQKAYSSPTFSYTTYDNLGRITEVGEISQSAASDTMTFNIAYSSSLLSSWIQAGSPSQITNTYYDELAFTVNYGDFEQNHLRNRVASTTFTTTGGASNYQSAVHYDYDVHGNVKAMVRETPGLDSIFEEYKIIRYEYELVSGNVLKVLYQQDSIDRFFHKYEYDADNRVIGAYTSRDQIHWDRDAKYMYYLHGPVARTELGELKVQGMDYAYTLHGWLKGVNSERLRTSHDIGKDGKVGATNQWVCADEFGFGLGYYQGDYGRIGSVTASTNFIIDKTGSRLQDTGRALYNGNISTMVTAIGQFMEQGDVPFGRAFQYDQLNRIVASRAFNNVDTTNNKWNSGSGPLTQFATNYTYDANGNILNLVRKGKSSQPNMDELSYHYYSGTNRLEYVDDAISSANYGIDIDDQAAGNYSYDAIGNLDSDASEEIEEITWTVYGKIKSITRTSTSAKPDLEFEYSPDGYRSAKHVTDPTTGSVTSTWYVRDASGNIMATYEKRDFTTLDTTTISLAELNSLVIADWGDHVFARFLNEAVQLHTMMDASQFTSLKLAMSGAMELETMLKMHSPLQLLVNETTLADNTVSSYTAADFFSAMKSYYGSANTFGNTVLMNGCGNELISYLAGNYYTTNNFVRTLFTNNATEATAVWNYFYAPTPYPGASGAAAYLQSNVSPVQDLYDQIGIQFSAIDVVTEFENTISTATLESALQGFGSLKTCTRTVLGDNDMFTILDLYDRTNLWDEMISNSTLSDLADMMITYEPGFFMESAVELNTNRANDLFDNLPVTYHITDYLNAILNYVPFGSSYYTNIVNQLIGLGHAAGNWEYSASEHHIYGSSRVGVYQTNLLTRARYNQGDIGITLEDAEYASLYRGKRHYELSNHLGNVQVVVTDKRISVCDSELEVDYFKAEVLSATDYYPFGMMMPDRQWYANSDSSSYSFGFNGMERDNGISGQGNSYTTEFRQYDTRLGRWMSIDPVIFHWRSPYLFSSNDPIRYNDPQGDCEKCKEEKNAKQGAVVTDNDGSDYQYVDGDWKKVEYRACAEEVVVQAIKGYLTPANPIDAEEVKLSPAANPSMGSVVLPLIASLEGTTGGTIIGSGVSVTAGPGILVTAAVAGGVYGTYLWVDEVATQLDDLYTLKGVALADLVFKVETGVEAIRRGYHEGDPTEKYQMYCIYIIDPLTSEIEVLKYGMTGQKNYVRGGNPRPETQVRKFMKMDQYKDKIVSYTILAQSDSKFTILCAERVAVMIHVYNHNGRMPEQQLYPSSNMGEIRKITDIFNWMY